MINYKTFNNIHLPFKGGFGAKFGFPWLITGFAGKLLFNELSNVLIFTLLLAFLCKVLTFACNVERFNVLLLCCCTEILELVVVVLLPFLITNDCFETWMSSDGWKNWNETLSEMVWVVLYAKRLQMTGKWLQ